MSEPGGGRRVDHVDVVDLLVPERRLLCELLAGLDEHEWTVPTECPAWTVQGIALHVLGDDLSLLSRQRDAEVPSLLTEASLPLWEGAPPNLLDRFNERWVHASAFLSPPLLLDLLEHTGEWTHAWYASTPGDALGETVLLFGDGPAPYRSIAAREYLERWVHHLQIRRALGLEPGPVGDPPYGPRARAVVALALPALFTVLAPAEDATIQVSLGATSWTCGWTERERWEIVRDPTGTATVTLSVPEEHVTELISRGLTRDRAEATIEATGDVRLADVLRPGMAGVMSQYYAEL